MRHKKILIILLCFFPIVMQGYCVTKSCDDTIDYAMKRYKTKSIKRMDDFRKTLKKITYISETYENNLFLVDRNETIKLKARLILQSQQIKELVHHTKTK